MVRTVTTLLASATVAGQILLLGGILFVVAGQARKTTDAYAKFIRTYAHRFMFLVSLTAMFGSLFFSEVAHYVPCTLCWYQRILMYPQALMLGLDLARGKKTATPYVLLLSLIGLVFALYHYQLQLFPRHTLFCTAGSDCATKVSFTFGYISIPLMAATAFSLNLLTVLLSRKRG